MIELSTILEPVNKRACIAQWFGAVARRMLVIFAFVLVAGCASTVDDLVPDKNTVGVPIDGVGHYGSGIVITDFSVNGRWGGRTDGWGGGGGMCCALLPRKIPKEAMLVTVKWATSRGNVPEYREHEVTVPVHFAVAPGDGGSGLYVHFLPGHKVEVWYSSPGPASTKYPGPKYPSAPAPLYVPLPDEQPQPSIGSKK